MKDTWAEKFEGIIDSVDMADLVDPRSPLDLSPYEMQQTMVAINEVAIYLGDAVLEWMNTKTNPIPKDATMLLRELRNIAEELNEVMLFCYCDEEECEDCTDTTLCETCYEIIGEVDSDE